MDNHNIERSSIQLSKKDYHALLKSEFKGKSRYAATLLPVIGKRIATRQKPFTHCGKTPVLNATDGRQAVATAVLTGKPFMAARYGTGEGKSLLEYWRLKLRYGDVPDKFSQNALDILCENAGFFPNDKAAVWKWAEAESAAYADLDMLALMDSVAEDWVTTRLCPQAVLTQNGAYGSARDNWTHALKGKKVLVVHPYSKTIMNQYTQKREQIFPGYDTLPEFDLTCVKAVQTSAGGTDDRFKTWFEALDYMTEEIAKADFDVCILGCGAYGFQLSSRVKQMGKIAVQMGGSTQILFGIRGARWDKKFSYWYNDAWVSPLDEDKPKGFENIEGGCYW